LLLGGRGRRKKLRGGPGGDSGQWSVASEKQRVTDH
jgi:hypothetical protein